MIPSIRRHLLAACIIAVLALAGLGSHPTALIDPRRPDAIRGRRAARRVSLAQHRPQPRRPIDCRRGREGPPARGVLRRRRRRAVEDDRCRQHLGAGHRRPDQQLLGRRRRGLRVEPRHRVHRHGRVVHPRQHHARRRRLQVHRRGQDLGEGRLRQRRRHLQDPHPPHQPRHRLRRGLRAVLRAERRARRVQEHRRRQDLAAHAVPRSAHGRGGPGDRRQQSRT